MSLAHHKCLNKTRSQCNRNANDHSFILSYSSLLCFHWLLHGYITDSEPCWSKLSWTYYTACNTLSVHERHINTKRLTKSNCTHRAMLYFSLIQTSMSNRTLQNFKNLQVVDLCPFVLSKRRITCCFTFIISSVESSDKLCSKVLSDIRLCMRLSMNNGGMNWGFSSCCQKLFFRSVIHCNLTFVNYPDLQRQPMFTLRKGNPGDSVAP